MPSVVGLSLRPSLEPGQLAEVSVVASVVFAAGLADEEVSGLKKAANRLIFWLARTTLLYRMRNLGIRTSVTFARRSTYVQVSTRAMQGIIRPVIGDN